jgi:endonuclease/exonuclease/phosphatase family metal-dependent hydrolase
MIGLVIILALVLLLLGGLVWAGGGKTIHEPQGSGIIESIPDALEREPAAPETLVVLSYDLVYALGAQLASPTVSDAVAICDHLDQIVETIAASGADVALLQEVDFASRRTHNIDQLHYIAAALGWGFAAHAITWECRYLPLPCWPLGRPTGRLRAGMGVISRYPLIQNTRQRLSQPRSQPLLAALFAPYYTVQMVDVQCGNQTIRLLNVHLTAHDAATRQQQARELVAFVHQVETLTSVLMGAFNAAFPGTAEAGTNTGSAQDQTMDIVRTGLHGRFRTPPKAAATAHCRLEHVFIGSGLQALEMQAMALDTPLSAHRPLVVRLRWALPLIISNGRSTHERL